MSKENEKFHKDLDLDSRLVFAKVQGVAMYTARSLGMSIQEVSDREEWLKRQDKEYIEEVANRVVDMQKVFQKEEQKKRVN